MKEQELIILEKKLHKIASEEIRLILGGKDPKELHENEPRKLFNLVAGILRRERRILTKIQKDKIIHSVVNRIIGFGPLEPLLRNPEISEIMVNSPKEIFIEVNGKVKRVNDGFIDKQQIMHVAERIVGPIGRRVDESNPFVDARLPDGSRVNIVIPPLAIQSPILTIRRFSKEPFTLDRLIAQKTINRQIADFLRKCILSKVNILISGGTGSGKTSTLNALARCIPAIERVITIEDTAELHIEGENIVGLESRPASLEGKGEISIRTMVKNSLRMRPDRIIIGEVRGAEAFDMLQAMNTGHPGSMTTIHANSPIDAVRRLESMVLIANLELPQPVIRDQIINAIGVILQLERLSDGSRKIVSIGELYKTEPTKDQSQAIHIHELFRFQKDESNNGGHGGGEFLYTKKIPRIYTRLVSNR